MIEIESILLSHGKNKTESEVLYVVAAQALGVLLKL